RCVDQTLYFRFREILPEAHILVTGFSWGRKRRHGYSLCCNSVSNSVGVLAAMGEAVKSPTLRVAITSHPPAKADAAMQASSRSVIWSRWAVVAISSVNGIRVSCVQKWTSTARVRASLII